MYDFIQALTGDGEITASLRGDGWYAVVISYSFVRYDVI